MRFVYSRAGGNNAVDQLDAGWRVDAGARHLPHRQAWVRHGAALNDIWHALASLAPTPVALRWATPQQQACEARDEQQTLLLQQDPYGHWRVDAGDARDARDARSASTGGHAAHQPERACYIIELRHAG